MPYDQVMHKWKAGTLKSGGSGKPVKSQAQAIAIMLSEKAKAKSNPEYRAVNAQSGLQSVPGAMPPGAAPPVPNPGLTLFRKMLAARAIGAKSKAGASKPRPKPVTPPPPMPF